MNTLKNTRLVLCMLALGFIGSAVQAHAVHFERDLYGDGVPNAVEETDDDDYLEGEISQESAREEAAVPGPKNVVLFFARFPTAKKKHVVNKLNASEVVYFGFPVQSSVGVTTKAKPRDISANLVALFRKRRAAAASSDANSCKVELDASVAKLLEWARNSRFMATGVVANGKHSQEMTLTQVHKGSGGVEMLREFTKEGGFARNAAKRVKGRSSGVEASGVDPSGAIHNVAVHSGVDHSGVDHSGVDHSGVDHSGVVHSGVDHSGVEHSGVDHSGVDGSGMDSSGVNPSGGVHSGADEGIGSCLVDTVSVRKREAADHTVQPKVDTSLDPFKKLDIFRRYIFDNIFNFIGFDFADNLDSDLQGMELKAINPATELVRGVLKGLQADAGDTGFVLVVSAGELADLNDAVRLVRDRTDAGETLIAVAGQCPGDDVDAIGLNPLPNHLSMERMFGSRPGGAVRRRSVEKDPQVPLYATGPKSDQLGKVDLLWKIPTEIQRIMKADVKRSRASASRSAAGMKRRQSKEYDVGNANDNGRVKGSFMKEVGVGGKVGASSSVDDNDGDETLMEEYIGEDEMAARGGKRSKKGVDTEDFSLEDEKVGTVGKRSKNGVDEEGFNGEEEKVGRVGKSLKKGVENEDYIEEDETVVATGGKRLKKGLAMDDYNGDDEKEATERKRSKKGVELEDFNEKDETEVKRGKRSKEEGTKAEEDVEVRVEQRAKKGVMDEGGQDSGSSLKVSAVAMAVGVVVVAVYIKLLIEA